MSAHAGEMTVRTMSAASSNSRPRSSQTPSRRHAVFRAPCVARPLAVILVMANAASIDPQPTITTAIVSIASATPSDI